MQPLLLLLTFVSGLVDATSYLNLGHVFVANMTGNVVFIGFAIAGAREFSLLNSVVAISAFLLGALLAGRLARGMRVTRPGLLRAAATAELAIALGAAVLVLIGTPLRGVPRYALVALLAAAMGIQSALTTRLQVPGFNSTVVLTTMLSTLAQESRIAGGSGAQNGWRVLAIGAMMAGGLVGALLVLHMALLAPLDLVVLVLAAVTLAASVIARSPAHAPDGG